MVCHLILITSMLYFGVDLSFCPVFLLQQTVHIPSPVIDSLVQEPLDSQKGISNLEKSITSLYKAILSVQDLSHVAAASDDSVDKYTRDAKQFCKRVYEFLVVMFKYQVILSFLRLHVPTNRQLIATGLTG